MIEFQTWICPKCSDDHRMDGPCSPPNTKPFSPSPDDNSYIAVKFRELESELKHVKRELADERSGIQDHSLEKHLRWELSAKETELSRYRDAVKVMRDGIESMIGVPCESCDHGYDDLPCTCGSTPPFYETAPKLLLAADRILGEKK